MIHIIIQEVIIQEAYGQLYTGWASQTEYKYDNAVQGFTHIMNNLMNYQYFSLSFVDEVLHGEEYKAFGVCPHQCWSETMVIQLIIEGMLGFKPDAVNNSFSLKPNLPANWDSLEVKNLKVGNGSISLDYKRADGELAFSDVAFIQEGSQLFNIKKPLHYFEPLKKLVWVTIHFTSLHSISKSLSLKSVSTTSTPLFIDFISPTSI